MFKHLIAKLKCNRGETPVDTEDTKKSGADDKSGQSGEKLDGLIQDIDLSDIKDLPEETQKIIIEKLTQKTKLYDAGYRAKSDDLAAQKKDLETKSDSLKDLEKLNEEIRGNPEMEKLVTKTINDFRAGKSTPKQTDKSLKKLDQLIDTAESADQREQLITMREIIKQETQPGASSEEIKKLQEEIAQLKQSTTAGLQGGIDSSVKVLREKYGDELIDKHDTQVRDMLAKYPTYLKNPEKVLFNLAETDEIFNAHEKIKAKQTELENKRKAGGVFPGGDSKPTEVEKPRDKGGRVDIKKYAEKLEQAGRFN